MFVNAFLVLRERTAQSILMTAKGKNDLLILLMMMIMINILVIMIIVMIIVMNSNNKFICFYC